MYPTREAWLEAAATRLWALLPERDGEGMTGPAIKVSVGWPKGRHGKHAVGECWAKSASDDKETSHIFIAPELSARETVLAVLMHELCHVWAGVESKHKGPFIRAMKHVGMVRPWTMSNPSPGLLEHLVGLVVELGEYPHVGLHAARKPKQKTRMRLYQCGHGQKIRAASDDLQAECKQCGSAFVRQGKGREEDEGEGE